MNTQQKVIGGVTQLPEVVGIAPARDRVKHRRGAHRRRCEALGPSAANGQEHQAGNQGFAEIATHDGLTDREEDKKNEDGIRGR
ncbi:hypothetical protein D3C87_1938660 [compost metagenome]